MKRLKKLEKNKKKNKDKKNTISPFGEKNLDLDFSSLKRKGRKKFKREKDEKIK